VDRLLQVGPLGRTWTLNLDPATSTLGSALDWPVLLSQAIELRRRGLPGPRRGVYALGEVPDAGGRAGFHYAWVDEESGARDEVRAIVEGPLALPALRHLGPATLIESDAEGEERQRWSVAGALLDRRESDLRTRASGARGE